MNPFEAYAHKATTRTPDRLIGPVKTRAEARLRYAEITGGLARRETCADLTAYLETIQQDIAQFRAELQYFWEGDGDFTGLQKEIERAMVRVDEGLDYPRYEEKEREYE